jgi:hypothetical protein
VSGNDLLTEGALAFAWALGLNTTLTKLTIGSSGLGDVGCCALARSLEHNTTLLELDM